MRMITAALAALALTASPAAADEAPMPTPGPIMGTIYVQTYDGPAPTPIAYVEVITMDEPVAYAPTITPGVVTYRGKVRRAVSIDGVIYLATGLRVGPRVAASFHMR